MSTNCKWKNHKQYTRGPHKYELQMAKSQTKKSQTPGPQEYKLWMTKQKCMKGCFAKLHNDLILLKIVNFHKYTGSLGTKSEDS